MRKRKYLTADDVAEIMEISKSGAYKLIHKLNQELKDAGYITTPGRISREYFESKLFKKSEDRMI